MARYLTDRSGSSSAPMSPTSTAHSRGYAVSTASSIASPSTIALAPSSAFPLLRQFLHFAKPEPRTIFFVTLTRVSTSPLAREISHLLMSDDGIKVLGQETGFVLCLEWNPTDILIKCMPHLVHENASHLASSIIQELCLQYCNQFKRVITRVAQPVR
jgi:hypothetical protein